MPCISSSLIGLMFIFPIASMDGDEKEIELTNYQRAILGLRAKEIRANLPSEKMLDQCIPASKWRYGPFTVYLFEWMPGYCGLTIIAKDGVLKRAIEWSCTDARVYFDEMTPRDKKQYEKLRQENPDTPEERFIGRWGWERSRQR